MTLDISPVDRITADDKIEVVKQKQSEYTLSGSIMVPKGMKLFYLDTDTCEVGEVKKTQPTYSLDKNESNHARAVHVPSRVYILALNRKNAIKKAKTKFPGIIILNDV